MKRSERAQHKVGDLLGGRWRLERVLGTGGMASVFAASDPAGLRVAIKLLHDELVEEEDVVQRFLREAHVASCIQHSGVVRIFEQHSSADEPTYIVMELLEGSTLAQRARAGMSLAEMLDYVDQTLDVLAVAHTAGIVHRDLKPANLFVTREGRVRVLDFGVARLHDGLSAEHRTRTGIALGTLPYMSPEQAAGRQQEVDARTDIFAMGAILFRHLTGRRIHEAESELDLLLRMVEAPAPPLRTVVPGIAAEVACVVDRALAFSPADRYPNASAMQADVRALRSGNVPSAALAREAGAEAPPTITQQPPATPNEEVGSPLARAGCLTALLFVLIALVAGIVLLLLVLYILLPVINLFWGNVPLSLELI